MYFFFPLKFKIELHLHLSNISVRPSSEWADNQLNRVAPGVANQITAVAYATPGCFLDAPLLQALRRPNVVAVQLSSYAKHYYLCIAAISK